MASRSLLADCLQKAGRGEVITLDRNTIRQALVATAAARGITTHKMSRVFTHFAMDYHTVLPTHLKVQQEALTKRLLENWFERRGMARRFKKVWQEIVATTAETVEDLAPEWLPWWQQLQAAPTLASNYALMARCIPFALPLGTLVPVYSTEAKYIHIDTDVLADLIGNTPAKLRQNGVHAAWSRFLHLDPNTRTKFDYHFLTDGVGASLLCKREIYLPRKGTLVAVPPTVHNNQPIVIGIDPGSNSIATCIRRDLRTGQEENMALGTRQYYEEAGMTFRTQKAKRLIRDADLSTWLGQWPSFKSTSAQDTTSRLASILESPNFKALLDLKCTRKYKRLRFNVDIKKKATLDGFCLKLIGDAAPQDLFVCFGDASYNPHLRGVQSSPRRQWLARRLKVNHGVTVVDVWEFNTSQICSKCEAPQKLADCKTASNSYKVRTCLGCQTIWDRDVNAARNILKVGLTGRANRPRLFSIGVSRYRIEMGLDE